MKSNKWVLVVGLVGAFTVQGTTEMQMGSLPFRSLFSQCGVVDCLLYSSLDFGLFTWLHTYDSAAPPAEGVVCIFLPWTLDSDVWVALTYGTGPVCRCTIISLELRDLFSPSLLHFFLCVGDLPRIAHFLWVGTWPRIAHSSQEETGGAEASCSSWTQPRWADP